jgi:hypothetical protein
MYLQTKLFSTMVLSATKMLDENCLYDRVMRNVMNGEAFSFASDSKGVSEKW